ncbi:hypothetical protein C0991_005366 [Blastosporella zonata]|nr:hypothetical protein C0991_005366 [Blastosporella zonata]
MFNNNVTSSWATPQQNQQQQQTGAFGQPVGGFGTSSGAFGATGTSAFGQAQPAQQQQTNPMFGTPAANTGTGFGAFGGANTSQSNAANPMFGGAKPSTGFGAFGGGGGTFGGGGAFGQTNTASGSGTGAFGQPATTATTSAFGGGNSIFGASKPTTAFGATTGTGAQASVPVVTAGSSNPPYAVHTEKEPITSEIRVQDYNQGRKTASSFGPGAFGATQPPATGGIFGAQPTQTASAFGAPAATTGGFGAFGAPAANTTTAPTTTGLFGGGGAFGQPQQQQPQQQTSAFGAFGSTATQPQQQQTGGGIFGGGSAFGSTAPKPAFGAFGGGGGTGTGAFGGGGAFGQAQQQQTQQPAGGLLGATNPASNTTAFGGFGAANTNANKSIFGQPTTGFGAFSSNTQQQQPQQPQQTNSLFGGGNTGTGLFGQQQQTQQPQGTQQPAANPLFGGGQTGGTGLFGGGGGLFGNNNQQTQTQQPNQTSTFGGFGAKPVQPAGSLFGGGFGQSTTANQPTTSIFGNTLGGQQQQNNQSTFGGGLFGKPAPALGTSMSTGGSNLFGSANQTGGLFNASAAAPGAQGTLTASISEPIGSDLPIFNILPPGPRLLDLETSQQKKKPGFFVDIPTRSPMPKVGYTPANSRLRGFGSTFASPAPSAPSYASSLLLTSSKSNPLSLSRVGDANSSSFDAFLLGRSSSPALGSGNKQSVKKVILDKKIEPTELFSKSGGSPGLRGGKVVFSPALSAASREKDVQAALNPTHLESPTPAPRPQRTPNRFTAQSQQPVEEDAQGRELEEGDYYVKPDLATLKQTGYDELSSFKDLIIGRVGFGEIHFLEPVDLTGLPKLGALLGEVVRFDEKECSVYPESDDVDKPPPGSGLNVAARLSLLNCWAVDKSTREPITDETHPSAAKHLRRLKKIPNTHFESFDIAEGKWTFKVDHF